MEDADELAADDLTLRLGIGNAGQLIQETIRGVNINEVCSKLILEYINNLLALTFAHEAMVDMDAGKLLADGLDQQCGYNRGIHTTRQSEQNLAIADLCAQRSDLFLDERFSQRAGCDALHIRRTDIGRIIHWNRPLSYFKNMVYYIAFCLKRKAKMFNKIINAIYREIRYIA